MPRFYGLTVSFVLGADAVAVAEYDHYIDEDEPDAINQTVAFGNLTLQPARGEDLATVLRLLADRVDAAHPRDPAGT
jgi:hypothetical protein